MTSTPSASLHVLPPQPADITPSLDHPPTPLTPRTLSSAISSNAQLSEESSYPPAAQPPPSTEDPARPCDPTMPGSVSATPVPQKYGHEPQPSASSSTKDARADVDQASASQLPVLSIGLKCAPPDVLPPSPPLTVEARDDEVEDAEDIVNLNTVASSSSAQPSSNTDAAGPSGMREADITEWRASMQRGMDEVEEEDEEDEDGEPMGDGEYDPYDLGYSPDPTPITPVGPSAHAGMRGRGTLHETPDHPLQLEEGHAPSPPPWEIIEPPETNISMRAGPIAGARAPNGGPKPSSSRPLIPHSAYYFGPPPIDSAYGTDPIGQFGVHHPREIIRIERDYSGGELVQFASSYPLELEGRITPTQFLETINAINERLIDAYSLNHSLIDNALAFLTLQLSRFVITSHYEKEMRRLHELIDTLNKSVYNPAGLNILWPRKVAFMFLEIEYY